MNSQDNENARQQARAQLDSIIAMLARVDHCGDCNGEDCELSADEMDGYSVEDYHDHEQAEDAIREDALSVEVRSGWHAPGEDGKDVEYNILLCTGGPAVRITGELNHFGEPDSARLEYQDWFTPWTEYVCRLAEKQVLVRYASYYLGY